MTGNTIAERMLFEKYRELNRTKNQAAKMLRAMQSERGLKRAAEDEDEEQRMLKAKLVLEESQKKRQEKEKEKEYKFIQISKEKGRQRAQAAGDEGKDREANATAPPPPPPPPDSYAALLQRLPWLEKGFRGERTLEYYLHTAYIGDLFLDHVPEAVVDQQLRISFSSFGNIVEFKILNQKRCAFVTYEHQESVSQAIHTANGQMFMGVRLRVSTAKVPPNLRHQMNSGGAGHGGNAPPPSHYEHVERPGLGYTGTGPGTSTTPDPHSAGEGGQSHAGEGGETMAPHEEDQSQHQQQEEEDSHRRPSGGWRDQDAPTEDTAADEGRGAVTYDDL